MLHEDAKGRRIRLHVKAQCGHESHTIRTLLVKIKGLPTEFSLNWFHRVIWREEY